MENKNCAIVISSCDAYADAWDPFFTLFFRYWPDCPFRIILISNGREYNDARVTTYKIKNDLGWSGNLIEALKNIGEDYVIYFQEDYFLRKKVITEKIFAALKLIAETRAAYLRLYPCPGPDLPFNDSQEIGMIGRGAAYRNSTQTAIWDRQIFLSLLKDGETGWDFETGGGLERSRKIDQPFLSFRAPAIDYFCTAILKGKYLYDAVRFCRREGIRLDLTKRKAENFFGFIIRKSGLKQKLYPSKKWLLKK
ncbi:MAG: hypothetical protein PHE24_06010 [Patescibacteria group bacterium]|nr:hypothetical protein [Patescibacteria group bacterium]